MTKPDWDRLSPTTYVKVWEACVLAVGLEPSSMNFEDDRWGKHKGETRPYITSKSFPTPEVEKNYKALFKELVANLFEGNHFRVKDINYLQGKGYCGIPLDEFVRWANLNVEWLALPPELTGLILDKTNGDSTQTEAKVKPVSVIVTEQSCIDEDAANELLSKLPEVNPSSESDIALASDVQAAGGPSRAPANSEDGETSAIGLIGQKGRQAKNNKRLSHINATNRLGDDEKKIIFGSLEEAKASIVLRYDALQSTNRLNDNTAVLAELHRLIGCDTLGNPLYSLKGLLPNITKWRPKT